MTFDNSKVNVKNFTDKGRGLITAEKIGKGEVIVRCPVKILDTLEFEMLRIMPAISAYAQQRTQQLDLDTLLETLADFLSNPAQVLGCNQSESSQDSTIMYTFTWDRSEQEGGNTAAIAFGLASLCNHSPDEHCANARIRQLPKTEEIELVATTKIEKGNEVLIRYRSVPFNETN